MDIDHKGLLSSSSSSSVSALDEDEIKKDEALENGEQISIIFKVPNSLSEMYLEYHKI
jgi:hypothetical protein